MKNFLPTLLPALSLLALGGCAGTAALSTTESDGVYYSSQDRTTQNARAVAATTAPSETATGDELTNPDYAGQSSSSASGSTEYYDDDYAYSSRIRRFHQPYYRSFGYGYNDFIYADPFWYGGPAYSAWGPAYGYGGFYDPFWGPSYYGGSFVNINIGFGNPYWGWGRPWGWNRWGYGGYGRGYYDGYYSGLYGGGYGGYYGNGGYYGGGYGVGGGTVRNVYYGPRSGRSAEATTASGGRMGNAAAPAGGRGRVSQGGVAAPGSSTSTGGLVGGTAAPTGRGTTRITDSAPNAAASPAVRGGRTVQLADQPSTTQPSPNTRYQPIQDAATDAASPTRAGEGRRWRVAQDAAAGSTTAPASSDYSQPRRSRSIFNSGVSPSGSGQTADQPARRQRTFEAPQQRTYEAPQRTYEQPTRSYSEPSRSFSVPSGDGGGRSGGGSNGGGGGGRGRVN